MDPGTYPGCLPRDPFSGPGTRVSSVGLGAAGLLWSSSPRPCTGFIAGDRVGAPGSAVGGSRLSTAGGPGDGRDSGWECEQRTRGRMERRGAPWHRDTNARTGASRDETRTSEQWGQQGQGWGGRGRGVPAPHVPLYTVGGAWCPLLPVLKYCSLTDMALTMGPEMRGGVGGSPPTSRCWDTPGSPRGPPCLGTRDGGSCGQGAWLCALGMAQGGMGQGDGSAGDKGRQAEACRGPLEGQEWQDWGHGEPPRGSR